MVYQISNIHYSKCPNKSQIRKVPTSLNLNYKYAYVGVYYKYLI